MKTTLLQKTWLRSCIGLFLLVILSGCDDDDEGAYSFHHAPEEYQEIVQIEGNQIAMNLV